MMKHYLIGSIGFAVAIYSQSCVAAGVGEIFGQVLGRTAGNAAGKALANDQDIESALKKMAVQINKNMPTAVDAITRIDNLTTGPGRKFTYNYSVLNTQSSDPNRITQNMRPRLIKSICPNQGMQIFFKSGVTVGYAYRGADGRIATTVDITPADCGF